jgi:hypothetical protein
MSPFSATNRKNSATVIVFYILFTFLHYFKHNWNFRVKKSGTQSNIFMKSWICLMRTVIFGSDELMRKRLAINTKNRLTAQHSRSWPGWFNQWAFWLRNSFCFFNVWDWIGSRNLYVLCILLLYYCRCCWANVCPFTMDFMSYYVSRIVYVYLGYVCWDAVEIVVIWRCIMRFLGCCQDVYAIYVSFALSIKVLNKTLWPSLFAEPPTNRK